MKTIAISRAGLSVLLLLWLAIHADYARAAISNLGVFDSALSRYVDAARGWQAVVTERASWLFWTLAVISMVWTFGTMALRKADLAEFYSEFVRFTVFTGFYWWLLVNGPDFAMSITDSLRKLGGLASGLGPNLTPSGIVDVGFFIFGKVADNASVWSPVHGICGLLIAAVILVVFALVGVNMLLLLISSWILAYAGVFFLGFGGSRWTSEIAIGYYRTVLNIAGQLFAMVLLVGIGKNFVVDYYASMSGSLRIKELGAMLVVAVILLALVKTIPGLIGGLAGGNTGSLGSGFGAGAAVAAATMAGAAISTGGAALLGAAAGGAGGAQALMAAFSKALASESSGGVKALVNAAGGSGDGSVSANGGSGPSLATAMGDSSEGMSSAPSPSASTTESQPAESSSSNPRGETPQSETASSSATEERPPSAPATNSQDTAGPGSTSSRTARVVAGTVANLATGAWDVAKSKASDIRGAAANRIADTTGGKIAAAIRAMDSEQKSATANGFAGDSLSAGKQQVDAESEIAAFRDRDSDHGKD